MDRSQDPLPDEFLIQVVSVLTPQDFWIQKVSKDNHSDGENPIIRAGIYGLFPTESEFITLRDEITIRKSKSWNHTSNSWFCKFINEAKDDILFVPKATVNTEYSVDGISPICMYGELYVYKNGEAICVSKLLRNQRLAYKSYTQFDRYLKADRLPVILSQKERTFVINTITNAIPDFEIADHLAYRQHHMNLYRPVGDRDQQIEDAKHVMRVVLRYFGRSKDEIDGNLKMKEDEWNLKMEDLDSYITVSCRKDAMERRGIRKKPKTPLIVTAARNEQDIVPIIGQSDTQEVCTSYMLYPSGMSINNVITIKKESTNDFKISPETSQSSVNAVNNIHTSVSGENIINMSQSGLNRDTDIVGAFQNRSKYSPHVAESTPDDKMFTSKNKLCFSESNYNSSFCSTKISMDTEDNFKSTIGESGTRRDRNRVSSVDDMNSSKDTSKFSDTSKASFEESIDFTLEKDSLELKVSNLNDNSHISFDDVDNHRNISSVTNFTGISLKSCLDKPELPPLWVKHDKEVDERRAAELNVFCKVTDSPSETLNTIKTDIENLSNSSDIVIDSSLDKKGDILKNTSNEEDDPDIVEENDAEQTHSLNSSISNYETSISRLDSLKISSILSIGKLIYKSAWNVKHSNKEITNINVDTDSDDNVLKTVGDTVCTVEKKYGKISLCNVDVEVKKPEIVDNVIGDAIPNPLIGSQLNFIKDDSSHRLHGLGLVNRIIEPKVMVHSVDVSKIGLWSTTAKVAFPIRIKDRLSMMNVTQPNRIQAAVWPAMMRGYSVALIGSSNSGKTLGILAPLCSYIAELEHVENSRGPIGLVIVPDVKTSLTVESVCRNLTHGTMIDGKLLKVLRVGSTSAKYTVLRVYEGCDILIITSVVFLELANSKIPILDLSRLKILVFDNADVLYSQYNDDIDKIYSMCCSDKNIQLQVVLSAKKWVEQFRPIIKDFDMPFVCISAFQECIIYSKVELVIEMLVKDDKLNCLTELLKIRAGIPWKLIILCINDEEIIDIYQNLKSLHYSVLKLNTSNNIEDIQIVQEGWDCNRKDQILVCCDMHVPLINAMNATWVINYSLPNKFSEFNMRFVTMVDSYTSMFAKQPSKIPLKVDIFVDSENSNQLPKIVDFAMRCGADVSEDVQLLADKIFRFQDAKRALNGASICDELLSTGKCVDLTSCVLRHSVVDKDVPAKWIPTSGTVIFKVLMIHRPDLLSVQLLEHISLDGVIKKYEQKHVEIAFKIATYFAVEDNVRAHGHAKVNDVAAVKIEDFNTYERCRVIKICTKTVIHEPDTIIVNRLESETMMETKACHLYHLPDELKNITSSVVRVRITGLRPADGAISWSNFAQREAKNILIDNNDSLFNRANIVLAIDNMLFFQTIQCCQQTRNSNVVEVKLNYSQHLATKQLVCENPCHLELLLQFCDKFSFKYPTKKNNTQIKCLDSKKYLLPEPQWAHMNENEYHEVYISSTVAPDQFYIRVVKYQDLLDSLIKDIQAYVEKRNNDFIPVKKRADWIFEVGTYCLAKFPDDELYSRVRIEQIFTETIETISTNQITDNRNRYECFFVDFGDWRIVGYEDLCPISSELVTRLPFLAIECRLFGLKSKNATWDEASSNYLYDISFETDNSDDLKIFYARFYKKETPEKTAGKKYAVALYDSNNKELINNAFVAEEFAYSVEDELKLIENDKIDMVKWYNLQYVTNAIDDDFEIMSDTPSSIPDFILNNGNLSDSTSFTDLTVDIASKKCDFKQNNTEKNNLDNIDFSYDAWDCQFDKCDVKRVTESNVIAIKDLPTIEEDSYASNPIRKRATITEVVDTSDTTVAINPTKPNKPLCHSVIDNMVKSKDRVLTCTKIIQENTPQKRIPQVLWYQTDTEVILKIKLIGVLEYTLDIDYRSVMFKTFLEDVTYEFKLNLFSTVVKDECTHRNIGSYLRVKLKKMRTVDWYQLMQGINSKLGWVSYDPDHICDSVDAEKHELEQSQEAAWQSKLEVIQRVHQIEMDGADSDDEAVNTDIYASKMNRMRREIMPFDPEDVYPDQKVLDDPLDF